MNTFAGLPRRWLRFSLGTLLFGMLCLAGTLGGYSRGYSIGYRHGGNAYWKDSRSQRTFSARDMVQQPAQAEDVEALVAQIKEVIGRRQSKWQPTNQPFEVTYLPGHEEVIVLANEAQHERAEAYFLAVRLSEGFDTGYNGPALHTRHLINVSDLLKPAEGGVAQGDGDLSINELLRGVGEFVPAWYASKKPRLSVSRGTLEVNGTAAEYRRVLRFLKALRTMRCEPCMG
jgi:hypothetical protein